MKKTFSKHLGFTVIGILFLLVLFSGCETTEKSEPEVVTTEEDFIQEIKILTKNTQLKEALIFLEESDEQTIKDQKDLTEIPAPPFGEETRSKAFAKYLAKYGADSVWIDEVGNAIGLRKGTERKNVLALCAHLDTVFPAETDVKVKVKGDTLSAPGISDDSRGLTTILAVLRAIEKAAIEVKDDILFIGNVGEEGVGDLRGMKHLFRDNGPKIDSFISIDGTGVERITNGGLGSHRYKVTFKGPGGHSWGAFGLSNPHHAAARAIIHFVDKADELTRKGPKTSYNIGRIGGGTSVNSIPFESWFEVDMRSISPKSLVELDSIFQRAMHKGLTEQNELKRRGNPMTVEIKMIGDRPSGTISSSSPLVQRALAVAEWMESEPKLRMSSTDSNIPISKGIPAITLGGGGVGKSAHSLHESFINEDGYKGIQRVLVIVTAHTGYISN